MQPEYIEEPYYIGRVMEFVYVSRVRQPKMTLSSNKKEATPTPPPTPTNGAQLRARLAWFQRPRDLPVTRVRAKDSRLLVATMHSDVNPVSAIKGKCNVRHTSEIADVSAWKSKPDHYYYAQLFDRYSTRLYDIIPVAQIRNAPQEVLQKLHDTYEFIFAESQKIADLVNTRRACTICAKWCSISESLKCSLCEKHYHMQCLDPPLSRKPAKGYTWQCAACMRRKLEQREKSVDEASSATTGVLEPGDRKRTTRSSSSDEFAIALRSSVATGMATPSGVAASAATSDTESRSGSKRLKLSHGDSRHGGDSTGSVVPRPKNRGLWPFRYFGINTNIDDVLHDDERIYPRAVSRIGPKYQAIVPDMVSPSGPELDNYLHGQHTAMAGGSQDAANANSSVLRQSYFGGMQGQNGHSASVINGTMPQNGNRGKDSSGGGWSSSGVISGGGGGTTRWHSKSADQMDAMWDEIEVRRGNHDEQLFFRQPSFLPDEELEMYINAIVPFLRRHFSNIHDFTLLDCQDAALHGLVLHGYDVEEALISIPECPEGYIRQREPGDYWTEEGLARFNDLLREYGSNLQSIHNNIPENTRRAVTLHYYLIRPTSLGKQILEAHDNNTRSGQRRPNLGQGESAVNIHVEVASDAGVSRSNTPASSPRTSGMATRDHSRQSNDSQDKPLRCLNCARDRASRWYSAPLEFTAHNTRSAKYSGARRVICNDCRDYWLQADVVNPSTPAPSDRPRQLMWRTSGNNWVHPLCALALKQSKLLYAHSNVVVDGVMALSKDMWMRRCSVCAKTGGAAIKCAEAGCGEGVHAICAHIGVSDGRDPLQASRAILEGYIDEPALNSSKVLKSIPESIKSKVQTNIVLRCAKHAHVKDKNTIGLDATDSEGNIAMSLVIASKLAPAKMQFRGAMLHARGVKSPRSIAALGSQNMGSAAAAVRAGGASAEMALNTEARGTSPSVLLKSVGNGSDAGSIQNLSTNDQSDAVEAIVKRPAVAWSGSDDEPSCIRCTTAFSPIWWPASPGLDLSAASKSGSAGLHVLCQRCYNNSAGAGGATAGQHNKVAST
ncbi:putative PHD type zinc finger protein with BAH domain-containing protein [Coemansia sp. Benny D160-2]|nr:putative PHD type zinc finger protein with BAH domain-containing protein [Coemansia sp. Benny D160-2]